MHLFGPQPRSSFSVIWFPTVWENLKGVQVVTHWTGQPMFSLGLLAAGGLCILLAFIPTSWIGKAAITRWKLIGEVNE
jgi:hypothetical protein